MIKIKSNKKDMAMRGYVVNVNKAQATDAMEDCKRYMVIDVTDDNLYTDILPVIRALHGYSRTQLANHIERSQASISQYEQGKRQPDSVARLKLSSFILGRGVYSERYRRFKDKRRKL